MHIILERMNKTDKEEQELRKKELADLIIRSVSEVTGIEVEEIKGKSRRRPLLDSRYICYLLLAENTEKFTRHYIGDLFHKDHSSITCGLISAKDIIEYDHNFSKLHSKACKKIESYKK